MSVDLILESFDGNFGIDCRCVHRKVISVFDVSFQFYTILKTFSLAVATESNSWGRRTKKASRVRAVSIHVIQKKLGVLIRLRMCLHFDKYWITNFRLCMNTCNAADLWANCMDLYKTWPSWLCRTNTTEGLQRQHNCLATCNCKGKIHDWVASIKNRLILVSFTTPARSNKV